MIPTLDQRLAMRQRPDVQRPVMKQAWRNLAFLHWEIDPDLIQQTLPPGLTVDTFEGKAFIGIVPFYMRHVRPVYLPSVPGISFFWKSMCARMSTTKTGHPVSGSIRWTQINGWQSRSRDHSTSCPISTQKWQQTSSATCSMWIIRFSAKAVTLHLCLSIAVRVHCVQQNRERRNSSW